MESANRDRAIRLMIVDDHPMVLSGMELQLGSAEDIEVVATTLDGQEAVELAEETRPDVVLMDLQLKRSKIDGVEAIRRILKHDPTVKVLVVSQFTEEKHIVQALGAGALGYADKVIDPQETVEAIRLVSRGQPFLHHPVYVKLCQILSELPEEADILEHDQVTSREQDVLDLLVKGMTNQEIADELTIAVSTVKSHLQSIYQKLGVSDRREAQLVELRRRAGNEG